MTAKKIDAEKTREHARWDAVEEATELIHEEQYHDALVKLRDVLNNDQGNAYAYYFLAIALFESGEMETARDAYRACLRLAPSHLGARVALCHVLRTLGDLRGAVREGVQALSLAAGDSDALHAVGLAYYARGDTSAARKYLGAFLDAKPEFEVAVEVRAMLDALDQQS